MDNKPTRVLIIEGDADQASIISSYLDGVAGRAEKFESTLAPRLSTACHLLGKQPFDAILLDLVLPQTVGLEGFHQIRRIKPATPIIVLTGLLDEPLASQAVTLGAHDYFIKGSPECCLIKRAVRYALERRRMAAIIEGLIGAEDAPQFVLDAAGVVRYANAAAEAAFGRSPAEVVNRPFGYPLPDEDAEMSIPSLKTPEKPLELIVRSITWNGAPARLVTGRDGALSRQLKGLEREVQAGHRTVEAKNHFMSHVSHELRNTLSTLTTAAFCLKEGIGGALTPRQTGLVEMIVRNLDRQTKIVENVLDLARFQSGKLKMQFRSVDLAALLERTAEEYGLSPTAAKIQIDVEGRLPLINGDPDLIAQVLHNLLDNALRFAKRRIVVAASRSGADDVVVSVLDDGAGIPPERLGDLFTEFAQLENAANGNERKPRGYKGTGLGLTICKEIVDAHQGRIWAENAPTHGARFSFSLRARKRPEGVAYDPERALAPSAGPVHGLPSNGDNASYSGHR